MLSRNNTQAENQSDDRLKTVVHSTKSIHTCRKNINIGFIYVLRRGSGIFCNMSLIVFYYKKQKIITLYNVECETFSYFCSQNKKTSSVAIAAR